MNKLILANWKANISPQAGRQWLGVFLESCEFIKDVEIILAVPFLFIQEVADRIADFPHISLAAQGVSPYPVGNYTGATPAGWLSGLARYGLLGHRERRKYFHESPDIIAAQVRECLAHGIVPILCLDDKGLAGMRAALDFDEMEQVIPAYTPEAATALERARETDGILEGVARIGNYFPGRPVLYGGGVTPENGGEILALPGVSGVLLGRGCLDAAAFVRLCCGDSDS